MIKIRKHQRTDLPYRLNWLNNPIANKFLGNNYVNGTNLNKQKKWFNDYEKAKNKKFFTICDDNKPIGMMGLSSIDKTSQNADLFIMIGDDDYRGKGIGKIAMLWLIDYGFNKLKLHKIKLGVNENNIPAIKLYQSVGFKIEGELKDEEIIDGTFSNLILMAIFNKNYYENINDQNS